MDLKKAENVVNILENEILSEDTSEMEGRYLTFLSDGQRYGIPIANVVQIVQMQEVTKIPESLDYVVGIINLRGSIIPLIDVRMRFGKGMTEYQERTCIIVADIQKTVVGFIVDAVDEVSTIDDTDISEPPSVASSDNEFITGVSKAQDKITLLLDVCRLLNKEEIDALARL